MGELRKAVRNVVVLRGGLTPKARGRIAEELAVVPSTIERLIVATGRCIGAGFDDARLDTLFLPMPVAWKGTMIQYVGRLQRIHEGKTEVRIVDHLDRQVPVLERMFSKKLRVYRSLGFTEVAAVDPIGGGGLGSTYADRPEESRHQEGTDGT